MECARLSAARHRTAINWLREGLEERGRVECRNTRKGERLCLSVNEILALRLRRGRPTDLVQLRKGSDATGKSGNRLEILTKRICDQDLLIVLAANLIVD